MSTKKNLLVLVLSIVAGSLLIVPRTRGPMGIYEAILQKLPLFIKDALVVSIVSVIALIFISVSTLGGFAVIVGGCR